MFPVQTKTMFLRSAILCERPCTGKRARASQRAPHPRLRCGCRAATFGSLELAVLIDKKIEPLYRFALLLTGNASAAERALLAVCSESAHHVDAFRTEASGIAFLVSKLRTRCVKNSVNPTDIPAEQSSVATKFHALPEPGRSALALFYLGIFSATEIAAMLNFTLEELSGALGDARDRLLAA